MNESNRIDASTDQAWQDEFVLASRLREMPADRIADQLKVVRTHCAQAGESAADAFGDPREYAAALAEGEGVPAVRTGRDLLAQLALAATAFAGTRMTIGAAFAMADGRDVEVQLGGLIAAVLLIGTVLLAVRLVSTRLSTAAQAIIATVVVAAAIVLSVVDTPRLGALPGWVALVVGLVLIAITVLAVRLSMRADGRLIDPVDGTPMR